MRQKKIRGHKRRWKTIENWRLDNLNFDLPDFLLKKRDRNYEKIGVHPWSGLSLTNSIVPEPNGKTKQKILNGLLDIYDDWKNQLDKLRQPYYLKIWLYEPRFSQSQIVCAIGENIDFYSNTFFKQEKTEYLNIDNYGVLNSRLENFVWEARLDEDFIDNVAIGEPENYASIQDFEESKKWFEKMLLKKHRKFVLENSTVVDFECYGFEKGIVWLGERKLNRNY